MTIAAPTSEVVLRDGSTVHMRRTSAADGALLAALLDRLSPEALWLRFLGTVAVAAAAERLVTEGTGLVALAGTPSRAVAHASFLPEAAGRAEVAFEVDGDWQGRGLATLLLGHLAQLSEEQGIEVFTALVLPDNHRMIKVFRESGFPSRSGRSPASCSRCPRSWGRGARPFEERDTSRRRRRSVTSSAHRRSQSSAPRAAGRWAARWSATSSPAASAGGSIRSIPTRRLIAGRRAHRSSPTSLGRWSSPSSR